VRRLADGRDVAPTWGGITLVGDDADDLERRRADRDRRGLSTDVWQGTAEDLRSFVGELQDAGSAWTIVLPAGGDDRLELVAGIVRG
jgi:hypothetical protein